MVKEKNKQITVALPPSVLGTLTFYVDGHNFRNRSHIIHQAVVEWIERQDKKRKGQLTINDAKPPKKAKK